MLDLLADYGLNDYYLESKPKKRAQFMKLAEALLKAGAPLSGLGCQTHLGADLPSGAITAALKDLATMGLPIRISEMDVSIVRGRGLMSSDADLITVMRQLESIRQEMLHGRQPTAAATQL